MNKTPSDNRHPYHILSELEEEERWGAIFKNVQPCKHSPRHLDIYLDPLNSFCNETQDVYSQTQGSTHHKKQTIGAPLPRKENCGSTWYRFRILSLTSLFNEVHIHWLSYLHSSDNNSSLFHVQCWGQCHKKLLSNNPPFRQSFDQVEEKT